MGRAGTPHHLGRGMLDPLQTRPSTRGLPYRAEFDRTWSNDTENWELASRLSRSLKVIEIYTDRSGTYDFLY